jgi:hypothetical protein
LEAFDIADKVVARVAWRRDDEDKANAQLIAAAPAMLETACVLTAKLSQLWDMPLGPDELDEWVEHLDWLDDHLSAEIIGLEQAITRAKGKQ